MSQKFLSIAALVAAGCIASTANAQSAVGNGGFEVDALYDLPAPPLGNWTGFFGGPPSAMLMAIRDTTAPRTDLSALKLAITGDGNAFCGVQQPIAGIQPGVTYRMQVWARAGGPINNGVEFRIEWKNAGGGFTAGQFDLNQAIQSSLTNTYQQYTIEAVAPAGTTQATLVFAAQTFTFNPLTPVFDTTAFFDDVTFAAVALPTQAACCIPDGSCVVALVGSCPSGSTQQAAGTTCSPNNCPAPSIGACCNNATGGCLVVDQSVCVTLGANYRGNGTTCSVGQCTVTPVCRADFNGQNGVDVQDIFEFLNAWFAGCP